MSVTSARTMRSLSGKQLDGYKPHSLHDSGRRYIESNCYADLLIELLHACGYEPLACFGHLVRLDFEGDQWTFFKPPPEDLECLFGIDIHEMQPYRPIPVQIAEQIGRRRTLIVELDSWYLPDTASTSYRTEHVKTSVAADAISVEREILRYFHGGGLFELSGDDFRGAFRIGEFSDDVLPPYTEIVRFDAGPQLDGDGLNEAALMLLRQHLAHVPAVNPFDRFAEHLGGELPRLLAGSLADYHGYAFATVRMVGAAFEIAKSHVEWLLGDRGAPATTAMNEIVDGCKALSFRLARRKPFDSSAAVAPLARAWSQAIDSLMLAAG